MTGLFAASVVTASPNKAPVAPESSTLEPTTAPVAGLSSTSVLFPALTTSRSPLVGSNAMFAGMFKAPATTGIFRVATGVDAVAAPGITVIVLSASLETYNVSLALS